MPLRHQRSRAKGSKQPQNTRYCGRGTQYGNPYVVGTHGTREECVEKYRAKLAAMPDLQAFLAPLKGYAYLSCFCPLAECCHVDVILELMHQ